MKAERIKTRVHHETHEIHERSRSYQNIGSNAFGFVYFVCFVVTPSSF